MSSPDRASSADARAPGGASTEGGRGAGSPPGGPLGGGTGTETAKTGPASSKPKSGRNALGQFAGFDVRDIVGLMDGPLRDEFPPSWDAARSLLKGFFGLEMAPEDRETWRALTGRTTAGRFDEAWIVAGRRAGKSKLVSLVAVWLACFETWKVSAGEVPTILVMSASRPQAARLKSYVVGMMRLWPRLERRIVSETAQSVTVLGADGKTAVEIAVTSANYRFSRGYSLCAVLADEIAFWPSEDHSQPDVEIVNSVRPGLATQPGSMLLAISSPYRKSGVLHQAWRDHYGREDPHRVVVKAATREMNPTVRPSLVERAMEEDPDRAAAEWLGEFRGDVSGLFSPEALEACVADGRLELPFTGSRRHVAFVDPSGGSNDSMTLAIAHDEDGVAVLDLARERRAPFTPEAVVSEYARILREWGIREATSDRYTSQWNVAAFRRHGIEIKFSQRSKSDIYLAAVPLVNSRRCELLDDKRLLSQLSRLDRFVSRGGKETVDHPRGQKDDVANAACGALVLASEGPKARAPRKRRVLWG